MKRVIDMTKLERKHYLKHYQGGFAMVLNEGIAVTGQIDEVDMEDGSVLINCGERSQWVEGEIVTPSLKQWKDLTEHDVHAIIDNCFFNGKKLNAQDIIQIIFRSAHVSVHMNDDYHLSPIHIQYSWSIATQSGVAIDNIGSIIFLLCELGFDVTGQFK